MRDLSNLRIKIFADGADFDGIMEMYRNPIIKGFTTNPTLMRKAGIKDYEQFARKVLKAIDDRPISFEVFADDFAAMIEQGRKISSWGPNINVKVPVTNTAGQFSGEVIEALSCSGIVVNVTAIMTVSQVEAVAKSLSPQTSAIISVFGGRIADTGIDPIPHMKLCKQALIARPKAQLLWASPRELLNIFHADEAGCDIITVSNDVLGKLNLVGKDLLEYSTETVRMFYNDAKASAFNINTD